MDAMTENDRELLRLCREERDHLEAEVKRLREQIERGASFHSQMKWANRTWCEECGDAWPCPTRRALKPTE